MKNYKTFALLLAFSAIGVSCSRTDSAVLDPAPPAETKANPVNDFVWKGLNSWYYWQKDVPSLADNAFTSNAAYIKFVNAQKTGDLFKSLLYKHQVVDRFSWIVEDVDALIAQFNGVSKNSGINFDLMYKDSGGYNVVGIVNYVVPNSPGAAAGLKRGDVISAVNGKALNKDNYKELFGEQFSLTIAQNVSVSSAGVVTTGGKNYNISAVVLEEDPVAYKEVIQSNNKKIGYLVYNGFQSNYNDDLNRAFGELKQAGITDLILDLRYNGGGSVETAVALGQMITGQFTDKPYVSLQFNDKHSQYSYTDNLQNKVATYDFVNGETTKTGEQVINSLNLNKVYILTSSGTASASELTISGLKPYINVVTIGDETFGKFVGSITLYDSPNSDYTSYEGRNKNHKWAMQPITFAYFNARKDMPPAKGILPNYEISPYDYFTTLKEFGNTSDPALAKALSLITGTNKMTNRRSNFTRPQAFVGSKKTLTKFGTELYLQDVSRLKK